MSAWGQSLQKPNIGVKSAFHLIATAERTEREVRKVPLAEVTRFYSITSSARTSSVGGTVIPIERAVFRFMDSLIRVGS
jgi:hypothetical protein